MEHNTKAWFNYGRGSVSAKLAKSDEDVLSQESELAQEGMSPTGLGAAVRIYGSKPLHATGDQPFHEGRGLGRGHGPETK